MFLFSKFFCGELFCLDVAIVGKEPFIFLHCTQIYVCMYMNVYLLPRGNAIDLKTCLSIQILVNFRSKTFSIEKFQLKNLLIFFIQKKFFLRW